jgi:hypothetical protein
MDPVAPPPPPNPIPPAKTDAHPINVPATAMAMISLVDLMIFPFFLWFLLSVG